MDNPTTTDASGGASGGVASGPEAARLMGGHASSFLEAILDASTDCIKIVDLDGSVSFMNENGRAAMEIDDVDCVAGAAWPDLWPIESRSDVRSSLVAARRGEASRFEAYCPTAKGTPKWWDVSVAPVPGGDGQPASIVSISRDVTDRVLRQKASEGHERELERLALTQASSLQEKELLMREVDHRVKNSLTLVTSILNVQSRGAADQEVKGELSRAAQRVGLVASIHERLYKGAVGELEIGSYLEDLCRDIEGSVGDARRVSVRVRSEPVHLHADLATVIGLVVSELVTNAIRHAFPKEGGTVTVSVERADGKTCLTVEDDGVGLPDGFEAGQGGGLGMRVVTAYVRQHGWTLEATSEGGARFCITM